MGYSFVIESLIKPAETIARNSADPAVIEQGWGGHPLFWIMPGKTDDPPTMTMWRKGDGVGHVIS